MTIRRFAIWLTTTVVCAAGVLFADIGFSDVTHANGAYGLLYWIPSVALGLWGARHLSDGPGRARWVGGAVAMLLPVYVLARWISLLTYG